MACLWKAGYAISDPGFSFYHPELRMFDPVSQEGRQLLYAFTEGLSGGCDASCQVKTDVRVLASRVLNPIQLGFRFETLNNFGVQTALKLQLCRSHSQSVSLWSSLCLTSCLACILLCLRTGAAALHARSVA